MPTIYIKGHITTVLSKLKYYSRSPAVTYTVKVIIYQKRCCFGPLIVSSMWPIDWRHERTQDHSIYRASVATRG